RSSPRSSTECGPCRRGARLEPEHLDRGDAREDFRPRLDQDRKSAAWHAPARGGLRREDGKASESRHHLIGISYRTKPRVSPNFRSAWHSAHFFMTTGTTVA